MAVLEKVMAALEGKASLEDVDQALQSGSLPSMTGFSPRKEREHSYDLFPNQTPRYCKTIGNHSTPLGTGRKRDLRSEKSKQTLSGKGNCNYKGFDKQDLTWLYIITFDIFWIMFVNILFVNIC